MERGKDEKVYSLIKFKHKHTFFVINLWKIVSIQIEDFFAGQGDKPAHEQLSIWGSYNLVVKYLKYQKGEVVTSEKILAKGFSRVFTPSPDYFSEEVAKLKRNLTCEAEYNYRTTPVSLFLFPLWSKIKFIPYKVTIIVQGKINAVPLTGFPEKTVKTNADSIPAENISMEVPVTRSVETLEKEALLKGAAGGLASRGEKPVVGDFFPSERVERTEESLGAQKEQKRRQEDLAAREKQKIATGIPVPNKKYYNTYRLFYDHFYRDQQAGESKKNKTK